MKNQLVVQVIVIIAAGVITLGSCAYDEVLPYQPDPGVEIFFSQDIIPIFNSTCNGAGCHNGSGQAPDLRPETAYDVLWMGGYINIETPEQSELYLWMTEVKGPMPPLGAIETNNATVLQWIEQGAKNN